MPTAEINSRKSHGSASHIAAVLFGGCDYEAILKKSAYMANAANSRFSALYIQPLRRKETSISKKQREEALYQARQYGAKTSVLEGSDPAKMIAEFAGLYHPTQIVLGSNTKDIGKNSFKGDLLQRLQNLLPDESYVIVTENKNQPEIVFESASKNVVYRNIALSALTVFMATVAGFILEKFGFPVASAIPIYLVAILIVSLISGSRKISIAASLVSILLYNYLFAEPRMSLSALNQNTLGLYVIMLVSSLIISFLVSSLKGHTDQARKNAYKTRLLFDTNELLQMAGSESEIIDILCQQTRLLTLKNIVYYGWDGKDLSPVRDYSIMNGEPPSMRTLTAEKEMARLAADSGDLTGYGTLNPGNATFLYLPVKTAERTIGVLGVEMKSGAWDDFESDVIQSMLTKSALSIENMYLAHEMEEARIQAKNEEQRSSLLRMISHDLRTPLTSIFGFANNLILDSKKAEDQKLDETSKEDMYRAIYDSTLWMNKQFENILTASHMEEGTIKINTSPNILEDSVDEAVREFMSTHTSHKVTVNHDADFLMADLDSSMMKHAIANVIDNAQQFSAPGSTIAIHTYEKDGQAFVDIADQGPGIDEETRAHMYEMLYTGNKVNADSRKNLGLGLFLSKKIIDAHHGTITQQNLQPHGSLFSISIPLSDISIQYE